MPGGTIPGRRCCHVMGQQALKDIPKTTEQAKRQKGPIPLNALFIVFGLLAVLVLYWVLPLLESVGE